jgi:hypothetical protein
MVDAAAGIAVTLSAEEDGIAFLTLFVRVFSGAELAKYLWRGVPDILVSKSLLAGTVHGRRDAKTLSEEIAARDLTDSPADEP